MPRGSLWLFYLFFRPRTFFAHFVQHDSGALAFFAAWLLGVESGIQALDSVLAGDAGFPPSPDISWGAYWRHCAVAGLLSGVVSFLVGAWWYRKRLEFCGAQRPDARLTRRVYLFASLVVAVPAILYTVWRTGEFATPNEAAVRSPCENIALALFLLWSVVTSYVGARQCFQLSTRAARIWFLLLPMAMYGLLLFAAFKIASQESWNPARIEPEPAVAAPRTLAGDAWRLRYPANWQAESGDDLIVVRSPRGAVEISVRLLPSKVDVDRHVEVIFAGVSTNLDSVGVAFDRGRVGTLGRPRLPLLRYERWPPRPRTGVRRQRTAAGDRRARNGRHRRRQTSGARVAVDPPLVRAEVGRSCDS